MRGDDAPTLGESHPYLALPPGNYFFVYCALEFQRDAAEIAAERDDVEAFYGARQIRRRAALAEGFDLIDAVQIFRHAKAHRMRRRPEHLGQRLRIVVQERGFVFRIKRVEFRDGFRIVDGHRVVLSGAGFSLWGFVLARSKPDRLKPAPQESE